ncbi:cob(I)alamin adenosyltransferase, partial [Basidiobolus meristosporus CBS 931.73]
RRPKKARVYTRTGDNGTSSLYNGDRAPKTSEYFHALGTVDELCCFIGVAYFYANKSGNTVLTEQLTEIQCRLFEIGSNIATPRNSSSQTQIERTNFDTGYVDDLELWIDSLDELLPPLRQFILPSGSETAVHLHQCRAVARRAERTVIPLVESGSADPVVSKYLNRLSDYFYVAARFATKIDQGTEVLYNFRKPGEGPAIKIKPRSMEKQQ